MADDFPADPSTTGQIVVGSTTPGRIDSIDDSDWFAVDLSAGPFELDLVSLEGLLPSFSGLFDSAGDPVAADLRRVFRDDEVVRYTFSIETPGDYFIEICAADEFHPLYDYAIQLEQAVVKSGTPGTDWLLWEPGVDIIDGGAGIDMASFVDSSLRLRIDLDTGIVQMLGGGSDQPTITLTSIEGVTGSSFADTFIGSEADDRFRGLGGPDTFFGAAGADVIDGGDGRDTLRAGRFTLDSEDISLSLLRGRGWIGEAAGDRYANIEDVVSGFGDDILTGDHGDNHLDAQYGDDILIGNAGDDYLDGYWGNDTAVFSYNADQYLVTTSGFVTTVTYIGPGAGDGTDTLAHMENLQFADDLVVV
ncbi:hypothetical protein ACG873_30030 [Mesorhizobium sp. AaZ16]|uniref:hypothetical protein n=1 Tax=Mesorhizobium sp. AaZ16 TaxID=3402289 RepID=UPI00374E924F